MSVSRGHASVVLLYYNFGLNQNARAFPGVQSVIIYFSNKWGRTREPFDFSLTFIDVTNIMEEDPLDLVK